MDEEQQVSNTLPVQPASKAPLTHVVTVRNAKEYLGESLLIIFSVVLALLLTELFSKIHENNRAKEIIEQLRAELVNNKVAEAMQYAYCEQVLQKLDSAAKNPGFAAQVINNGRLNISAIAPDGVSKRDLNDIAWEVARQNNIVSRLDQQTYTLLADIYEQQARSLKLESEVAKILLSFESRKPENLQNALLLVSDNYHGWVVDRAPSLLKKYEEAISKLSHY